MNETINHRQELWRRFAKSGSICDYLAYRGIPTVDGIQAAGGLHAANEIHAVKSFVKNSDQSQIP